MRIKFRIYFVVIILAHALFISFIGLPFSLNAGNLSIIKDRFEFRTDSRTLAKLISSSHKPEVICESKKICIMSDPDKVLMANVPIIFETCSIEDHQKIEGCSRPRLLLNLKTSDWLKVSIIK
jgi:hypothetical protein